MEEKKRRSLKKKVLVITYYWPPSGGAGVQRWLKLSKYLAKLGTEVHILTVDERYASYTNTDKSLCNDVHPEVIVHKTKSFEPINTYAKIVGKKNIPTAGFSNVDNSSFFQKSMNFIRSNFFIPDPRRGWKKYAVQKAREIIEQEQITTVITSSPPHSTQLIGLNLKKKHAINWIVDFRDPWTDIYYYSLLKHTSYSKKIDQKYEKEVIEKSDKIIAVSSGVKDLFLEKSNIVSADKIIVIPNGFDEEDTRKVAKKENKIFTLCYTGTMSDQYEPYIVFKALRHLKEEKNIEIKLQLVGTFSRNIQDQIKEQGVLYEFIGTVPHNEVVIYQKNADLLLLLIPNIELSKGILTGKLFEYLASGNQILALADKDGDVAEILSQCKAGEVFERDETERIILYLENMYNSYKTKDMPQTDFNEVKGYSRENQAKEIYDLI